LSFQHLTTRGQTYYFRLHIPLDLKSYFPSHEVKKSLRTKNLPAAKILCASWEDKFQKAFALLRCGCVSDEQLQALVAELFPEQNKEQTKSRQLLSELIQLYISDRGSQWSTKTNAEFSQYFSVLLSLLTDKPVPSIKRADCVACRQQLQSLPPNFTKKAQFKGMSAREIAKSNTTGQTLSAKTVNKYLTLLSTFFKWAIRQQIITHNPAEGLLLSVNKSASDEREIYSPEDLKLIKAKLPSPTVEPEKYWVPMVAMYSGLRLDEICQLHKEDIQTIDGILCFNINAKGSKKLKTANSARVVPVHPELVQRGLIEYWDSLEDGQLWPDLEPDKYGRWGRKLGNWYSRFNRRKITDNPKKCFHSFRHTVANHLKQSGINETVIAELIGHKNESITTGRYGKSYNVGVLAEALSALSY
jgi:integrase